MGFEAPGMSTDRVAEREIDRILADIHELRDAIVDAWRDSPVTLLSDERKRLREEIHATCELLTSLTS